MSAILSGDKNMIIDYVYCVHFGGSGTMLGDRAFKMDRDDNIIIDGVRCGGTPGLYELIFKRIPEDAIDTDVNKQKYKSILLHDKCPQTRSQRSKSHIG